MKKQTATKDKKVVSEGKSQGRKSHATVVQLLLCFFAGTFVGILIGPEYLNILPQKETISKLWENMPWNKEKDASTPVEIDMDKPTPTPYQPSPTPYQPFQPFQPSTEQEQDQYSWQSEKDTYLPKITFAKERAESYLAVVQQYSNQLEEQKKKLTQYRIISENAESLIDESTRLQIDIKKKIRYADKIQEQNQWQYLSKAYDDLKWYESQNAENSSLVTRIKQETNKISGDLQRYDDFERQKTKKVDSTPYVGSWYYSLQLQTQQLETSLKTATTSSNSSYVRIQTMLRMIQSMRYYPNEIHYSAEQLSLGMTHKNINDWLKRRRETAQTSSQQKQADLVSSFLQNNNKFIIDFDSEFSELQRELYTLQSQSNGQYISDETTKNLNQILRKIDRKYQDNYQIFNSAVLNFVQ